MNPTNERCDERSDALERLIDRTLRAQPPVPAPRTLEARVLAEIERDAHSWWRGGFIHWPLPARAVFVAASLVVVKFVLEAAVWVAMSVRAAPAAQTLDASVEKVYVARSVFASVADIGVYLVDSIPSYWLYAGVLGGVAVYATLFGLGAVAYKALYK